MRNLDDLFSYVQAPNPKSDRSDSNGRAVAAAALRVALRCRHRTPRATARTRTDVPSRRPRKRVAQAVIDGVPDGPSLDDALNRIAAAHDTAQQVIAGVQFWPVPGPVGFPVVPDQTQVPLALRDETLTKAEQQVVADEAAAEQVFQAEQVAASNTTEDLSAKQKARDAARPKAVEHP